MTNPLSDTATPMKHGMFVRLVLLAWLAGCLVSLAVHWSSVSSFEMYDADDYLRLVQVRDWLAGQSWFDLTQHRFDPPVGGDIHWSRIVDLPLAGGILLLRPLLGNEAAELVTFAVVPLLLLGVTMIGLSFAVEPLIGRFWAVLTSLLVILMPSLIHPLAPMRIDHHGWQIAMAAVTLLALLRLDGLRSGMAAGVGAAAWVSISAEGLPCVAAIGAVLGLRYLMVEGERARLVGYLGALAAASTSIFVATQDSARWLVPQCDAVSTPLLAPIIVAALLVPTGTHFWGRSLAGRFAVLSTAGGAAAAAFVLLGEGCSGGPFGKLDPLVYDLWYQRVLDGLPIWKQDPVLLAAVGTLWTPLVGAAGLWLGWRSAADAEEKRRWATIGMLLLPATLVAVMVHRAESVAHLYALPGCGLLFARLLPRIGRLGKAAARVPLTLAVLLLPSPAPAMIAALELHGDKELRAKSAATSSATEACLNLKDFAPLAKLPPQRLLAPLDIGPILLASTPHSIMGSGYHRNSGAMRNVIAAFLASPEQAHAFVRQREIGAVVYCRSFQEVEIYVSEAPQGLLARLERGEAPAWLEPVPVPASSDLRIWRVKPIR